MSRERIALLKPFAYIDLLGYNEAELTIETKGKTVEARRIFWRLYWIGFV